MKSKFEGQLKKMLKTSEVGGTKKRKFRTPTSNTLGIGLKAKKNRFSTSAL